MNEAYASRLAQVLDSFGTPLVIEPSPARRVRERTAEVPSYLFYESLPLVK
jgi:hypothetical protein